MDSWPKLVGRQDTIGELVNSENQRPIHIHGAPGVGCTSIALFIQRKLIAAGSVERGTLMQISPYSNWSAAIYGLGCFLGVELPGDEASVSSAIRNTQTNCLILDDADLHPALTEQLLETFPRIRWITTSRTPLDDTSTHISPLTPEQMARAFPNAPNAVISAGSPGLAKAHAQHGLTCWTDVGKQLTLDEQYLYRLPTVYGALADTLIERTPENPGPLRYPSRALREAVSEHCTPQEDAILRWGEAHRDDITLQALGHATKGPLPHGLLVALGQNREADNLSGIAIAAAAWEWIRRFQPATALEAVRASLRRVVRDDQVIGLLHFTEGHIHLTLGSDDLAEKSFHRGQTTLPGDSNWKIHLITGCAKAWVSRFNVQRATEWMDRLRTDNPGAVLRMSAALARNSGEWVGSTALLEAARQTWQPNTPPAAIQADIEAEQAAISLAKDNLVNAEQHLHNALRLAPNNPLNQANVHARLAELNLKRGRTDVHSHLDTAARHYRDLGSIQGLAAVWRLRGDVAAMSGEPKQAVAHWQHAATLCARTSDTQSLRPILERLLTLEREGTPGPHVQELESYLDLLDALSRK